MELTGPAARPYDAASDAKLLGTSMLLHDAKSDRGKRKDQLAWCRSQFSEEYWRLQPKGTRPRASPFPMSAVLISFFGGSRFSFAWPPTPTSFSAVARSCPSAGRWPSTRGGLTLLDTRVAFRQGPLKSTLARRRGACIHGPSRNVGPSWLAPSPSGMRMRRSAIPNSRTGKRKR